MPEVLSEAVFYPPVLLSGAEDSPPVVSETEELPPALPSGLEVSPPVQAARVSVMARAKISASNFFI